MQNRASLNISSWLCLAALIPAGFAIALCAGIHSPQAIPKFAGSVQYSGTVVTQDAQYDAQVDQWNYSDGTRTLHVDLHPVGKPSYVGITGDVGTDGKWMKIFFCGNHKLIGAAESKFIGGKGEFGCNGSVRKSDDTFSFQPNEADFGHIKPFSLQAIIFAEDELNTALAKVMNDDHIVASSKS